MEGHRSAFISNLLLFFALFAGALVRLYAVWQAGFVIHDGGLFYTLVQNIRSAGYALPMYTSYNQASIPFAYPPFAFYLLAGLNGVFGISVLTLLRWLPAIFSILTIPCFYRLSRRLFGEDEKAALATVLFALAPQAVGPQIMGGGIARALGALFTLLFLEYLYRTLKMQDWRFVGPSSVFGAMIILSHPEWTIHALVAATIFTLFFSHSRAGVLRAASVALGSALLSAAWWGTILVRHGFAPFQAALAAPGGFNTLQNFFTANWTGEILPALFVLALAGFVLGFFSGNAFLSLWLILDLVVEPRGSIRTDTTELVLLATITIYSILALLQRKKWCAPVSLAGSQMGAILVSLVTLLALFNGLSIGVRLSRYHVLSTADRQAFTWVQENTPPSSRFLIFAPQDIYMSPTTEWFPALTGRISLLTTQGTEWLSSPGHSYQAIVRLYESVESCRYLANPSSDPPGSTCLSAWSSKNAEPYDYVYFTTAYSDAIHDSSPDALLESLLQSGEYSIVYESPTVWILAIRQR